MFYLGGFIILIKNIHILMPDGKIQKNMFVGIFDKYIQYIGCTPPDKFYQQEYDGQGKLLIPGLINTHCHIPMTLLRSLGTDLALHQWLNTAIFPIEKRLTDRMVYFGSLLAIAEMLQSGVTSFNNMYYFGPSIANAVLDSQIKANIASDVLSKDEKEMINTNKDFQNAKYLYYNYHLSGEGKLKIDMSIHAEYTSTPHIVAAVAEFAASENLNIQLHLAETEKEIYDCYQRHQKTPTQYFRDLGIFDTKTTAAHCVYLTKEDRQILAQKNVTVSHCPISNLKLGSGIADIAAMMNDSICVSIGTDGPASNDNLNMLEDIKLTALLQKGTYKNPSILNTAQILEMATKNGAISQSRKDTGVIQQGKKADLTIVDLNSINLLPSTDIPSTFVYAAQPNNIVLTMVDGKILYQNGTFLTIDIEKVKYEVKCIAKELFC